MHCCTILCAFNACPSTRQSMKKPPQPLAIPDVLLPHLLMVQTLYMLSYTKKGGETDGTAGKKI